MIPGAVLDGVRTWSKGRAGPSTFIVADRITEGRAEIFARLQMLVRSFGCRGRLSANIDVTAATRARAWLVDLVRRRALSRRWRKLALGYIVDLFFARACRARPRNFVAGGKAGGHDGSANCRSRLGIIRAMAASPGRFGRRSQKRDLRWRCWSPIRL